MDHDLTIALATVALPKTSQPIPTKMQHRIAIIGGGISGLAAAHRLIELSETSNKRFHLTLLEASPRLGGTIQTETRDGFLLERGPDSFISEKPEALKLAQRLGIESRLIQTNQQHRRSFIVRKGRLRPVPEGFQLLAPTRFWPFITSDIFNLAGKLRMSADLFLPRKPTNGTNDESLASFVRRRLGQQALERMAQPMVGGIYTADPELLSLRATLPRFLDMEQEHRSLILGMWRKSRTVKNQGGVSGARYSLFLSFDQGMQVLVEALEKKIGEFRYADVRLNTSVKSVHRTADAWRIEDDTGSILEVDAVCFAIPGYVAARLIAPTSVTLASHLNQIRFASTATVNLGFRRADIKHALDGFGFVVPVIEKRSVIACTFASVKFAGRAPANHVLLRAFVGGALQPAMLDLDDAEIIRRVQSDLESLLGITGQPLFAEVSRWMNSMPQYQLGHLDLVNEIEAELRHLPELSLVGNSYRGAGVPDCIRSGEQAAEKFMA
jgi:oxygen-dependent protoporphyrinogen oxidase